MNLGKKLYKYAQILTPVFVIIGVLIYVLVNKSEQPIKSWEVASLYSTLAYAMIIFTFGFFGDKFKGVDLKWIAVIVILIFLIWCVAISTNKSEVIFLNIKLSRQGVLFSYFLITVLFSLISIIQIINRVPERDEIQYSVIYSDIPFAFSILIMFGYSSLFPDDFISIDNGAQINTFFSGAIAFQLLLSNIIWGLNDNKHYINDLINKKLNVLIIENLQIVLDYVKSRFIALSELSNNGGFQTDTICSNKSMFNNSELLKEKLLKTDILIIDRTIFNIYDGNSLNKPYVESDCIYIDSGDKGKNIIDLLRRNKDSTKRIKYVMLYTYDNYTSDRFSDFEQIENDIKLQLKDLFPKARINILLTYSSFFKDTIDIFETNYNNNRKYQKVARKNNLKLYGTILGDMIYYRVKTLVNNLK